MTLTKAALIALTTGLALLALLPLLPDPLYGAMFAAGVLGVVMLRQHSAYLARKRRAWQDLGNGITVGVPTTQH